MPEERYRTWTGLRKKKLIGILLMTPGRAPNNVRVLDNYGNVSLAHFTSQYYRIPNQLLMPMSARGTYLHTSSQTSSKRDLCVTIWLPQSL